MKKAVDFCHWLKGCLDINIYPEELDKYQIQIINEKLEEVFQALEKEEQEVKKSSLSFLCGSSTLCIVPQAHEKQNK